MVEQVSGGTRSRPVAIIGVSFWWLLKILCSCTPQSCLVLTPAAGACPAFTCCQCPTLDLIAWHRQQVLPPNPPPPNQNKSEAFLEPKQSVERLLVCNEAAPPQTLSKSSARAVTLLSLGLESLSPTPLSFPGSKCSQVQTDRVSGAKSLEKEGHGITPRVPPARS
ncbi:hypothetical protein MDA_GLEAN10004810 [Myotis davidii]|uniref:Uncharacterized protein n=1 Tax=Myotis davidii TaxID=225400 RepID=L5LUA0_MYODS|nr:hypothetical protein MDA_GLEAN10004810 [Myotis davidii]